MSLVAPLLVRRAIAARLTSPPSPPRAAPVNIDCSICELIGKHEKGGDGSDGALLDDTVQESDDHDLTRQTDGRHGEGVAYPANLRYGARGKQAHSCSYPAGRRSPFSPQRAP